VAGKLQKKISLVRYSCRW